MTGYAEPAVHTETAGERQLRELVERTHAETDQEIRRFNLSLERLHECIDAFYRLRIGHTEGHVRALMPCEPDRINTTETARGRSEQWVFGSWWLPLLRQWQAGRQADHLNLPGVSPPVRRGGVDALLTKQK